MCVAAEMRVGVTHVGTLSVGLAWLWDAVMDISLEPRYTHQHNPAGYLHDWTTKLKEKYFSFTEKTACLFAERDINFTS